MTSTDPARHVAPMTADTLIADQQLEIAGLLEQLRLERELHDKTARERDRLAEWVKRAKAETR